MKVVSCVTKTVRGLEVSPSKYQVKHVDNMNVSIILGGSLTGRYKYILD